MIEKEKISLGIRKSTRCGREDFWVADVFPYRGPDDLAHSYIQIDGTQGDYIDYPTAIDANSAVVLFEVKQSQKEISVGESKQIRTFDSGATRDTVDGKLDYVKALCPLVLRRYVQYLDKHRLQPNGSMRDFDNWKKGIPRETYHSSKGRHFFADWLLEEGYEVSDNHGPVDEEDALCGELFNTMGKLREVLKAKLTFKKKEKPDRTKPVPGGY